MATSGVYTLSRTMNQLAAESFDILQIGADGETLSGDMIGRWKESANLTIKEWQAQGIHLWSHTEGTLFLKVGQAKYDFRLSSTHAVNEWFETTTTADSLAGATSISVTSAADILDGDVIGVIQNNSDLFWTTVNGTPNGLSVQLDSAITLAASSGSAVRTYRPGTTTSPELIPITRIKNRGVRRKDSSNNEVPIVFASRQEYFDLPSKDQVGTPIQAHYARQDIAGEDAGIMYIWNSPSSSVPVINFSYERKLQIFVDADNTLDMPDYAQLAFIYEVAKRLIPKFGASESHAAWVNGEADRLKNDMLSFDAEVYPIKIKMRRHG